MPLPFTLATLQAALCLLMEDGDRDARPDASEPTVEFSLNAGGLRLLLDAVTFRLDRWPGGDPMEQADLQRMQVLLNAAILEVTFGETGMR
ncbi:hypothetical protein [Synechococcus sp. UW140]|uniref:hypothetical protein n=2 Tax=unclassified Synechococcus TaxID=2626047 RepID=UPI001FCBF621|nr:hypothetical protein [Synechococcus sp. UW140]